MDFTKNNIDIFDKYAKKYQDKYMDVSLYQDGLDEFCNNLIGNNAQILDIACGPGNISQYILKKRPDFQLLGIDLSEKMIELAKANNPFATFKVMDCKDINVFKQKFDGIVCAFCFPYLTKVAVQQLIIDTAALLNSHGVIYFSFMEGDYDKSGFQGAKQGDQMYVYDHPFEYIKAELSNANFTILNTSYLSSPANASYATKDVTLLARTNSQ